MSEDLRSKLNRLTLELEKYEVGKPLPIQIKDIHFILGAAGRLLTNIDKLEQTYKTDIGTACAEVERFRKKWKEARQLCVKQDNRIMIYRQLVDEVKQLSWWRITKPIRDIIARLDQAKKKFNEDKENIDAITSERSDIKVYTGRDRYDQETSTGGESGGDTTP